MHRVASAHVVPSLAAVLGILNLTIALIGGVTGDSKVAVAASGIAGAALIVTAVLSYLRVLPVSESDWVAAGIVCTSGLPALVFISVGQMERTVVIMLSLVVAGAATSRARAAVLSGAPLILGWAGATLAAVNRANAHEVAIWGASVVSAALIGLAIQHGRGNSLAAIGDAFGQHVNDALTDALTGLHNRRGLMLLGQHILDIATRKGDAVACTFIDVNGLKSVNDTLGHDAGDQLLIAVAEAIRESIRTSDVACRWGGDEFIVISQGSGIPADEMESRVHKSLASRADAQPLASITAGRALIEPWDQSDLETVIQRADQDMYVRRVVRRRALERKSGAKQPPTS